MSDCVTSINFSDGSRRSTLLLPHLLETVYGNRLFHCIVTWIGFQCAHDFAFITKKYCIIFNDVLYLKINVCKLIENTHFFHRIYFKQFKEMFKNKCLRINWKQIKSLIVEWLFSLYNNSRNIKLNRFNYFLFRLDVFN